MAGRLVHFEMPAQDDVRATRFYGDLFGWEWNTAEIGPGFDYHMVQFDEETGGAVYGSPEDLRGPIVYSTRPTSTRPSSASASSAARRRTRSRFPGSAGSPAASTPKGTPSACSRATSPSLRPRDRQPRSTGSPRADHSLQEPG